MEAESRASSALSQLVRALAASLLLHLAAVALVVSSYAGSIGAAPHDATAAQSAGSPPLPMARRWAWGCALN